MMIDSSSFILIRSVIQFRLIYLASNWNYARLWCKWIWEKHLSLEKMGNFPLMILLFPLEQFFSSNKRITLHLSSLILLSFINSKLWNLFVSMLLSWSFDKHHYWRRWWTRMRSMFQEEYLFSSLHSGRYLTCYSSTLKPVLMYSHSALDDGWIWSLWALFLWLEYFFLFARKH